MKKTKILKWLKENLHDKEPKKWIHQSIIEVIILGVILLGLTLWISGAINPNPNINLSCYKETNSSLIIVLDNPSDAPGEEINIMLKVPYGGHASNYPEYELCNISRHPLLLDNVTKVFCNYVPPNSKFALELPIQAETNHVNFTLWGKTTKKIEWGSATCRTYLPKEIWRIRGYLVK